MAQYINKATVVTEIEKRIKGLKDCHADTISGYAGEISGLERLLSFLDNLEVKDPYEQSVQYDSIKAGIKAHAETYSFNIESKLFNQLTKEQQELWKKEIEQACISGGEAGVELAKDPRYKENFEVGEVDLDYIKKELDDVVRIYKPNGDFGWGTLYNVATYFFELGLTHKEG